MLTTTLFIQVLLAAGSALVEPGPGSRVGGPADFQVHPDEPSTELLIELARRSGQRLSGSPVEELAGVTLGTHWDGKEQELVDFIGEKWLRGVKTCDGRVHGVVVLREFTNAAVSTYGPGVTYIADPGKATTATYSRVESALAAKDYLFETATPGEQKGLSSSILASFLGPGGERRLVQMYTKPSPSDRSGARGWYVGGVSVAVLSESVCTEGL